jgi:plastocyanin
MNRRQVTMAMIVGGTALALGQHGWRNPATAGGWASLELINPVQVAVVGVPVVIDAQVLAHGINPATGYPTEIRFTHDETDEDQLLRLDVLSEALAIVRGEHTFTEAGRYRMATSAAMGPELELGWVEVIAAREGDVISALRPSMEVAAACGDADVAGGVETDILDASFADPVLEVAAGTTVTWVNTSAVPHQVVFEDGAFESSLLLKRGDRFSVGFDDAGRYPYFCGPHPDMTGVVEVT